MEGTRIISLNKYNIYDHPLCIYKDTKRDEYRSKAGWIESQLEKGLRYKLLVARDKGSIGTIEYIPGYDAWRPVDCKEYMFIHCIFIEKKQDRNRGLGWSLVKDCIEDARDSGMKGVAVVTRKSSWMAGNELFIKNGFEIADSYPKDFELLAFRFKDIDLPSFRKDREKYPSNMKNGLYIIYSEQCPYVKKFLNDVPPTLKEFNIRPEMIRIESSDEAQKLANPYGTFTIIYNGNILEDHPISNTRFRNILKKSVLRDGD